ncbi:MAG: hypothetical protein ACPG8W_14550 [Candidatus Promineifilaceae bacterium]
MNQSTKSSSKTKPQETQTKQTQKSQPVNTTTQESGLGLNEGQLATHNGSADSQALLLDRLHPAQRTAMVQRMTQTHGNQHVAQIIARTQKQSAEPIQTTGRSSQLQLALDRYGVSLDSLQDNHSAHQAESDHSADTIQKSPDPTIQREEEGEGEKEEKNIKERLREAMGGWGTDEASIMEITSNATDAEKLEVLNDAALVQELQSELSRADMLAVLANLDASLTQRLNTAIDGWGADSQTILALTANASDAEKQAILGDADLVAKLGNELSREDMLTVLNNINAPAADKLRVAIQGWGADEAAIQAILTSATPADRDAALADAALISELSGEIEVGSMLSIFSASGVEFQPLMNFAFSSWEASLGDVASYVEAATPAERETVWSDSTLMDNAAGILGEDEYLDFVVALGMVQPGVTSEDSSSHTLAEDADEGIQDHLDTYVVESIKDGKQIEGLVGVVGDDDWDRAGIAHYGKDVWEDSKKDGLNGFVDGEGRVWIHKDRGNVGTMVHEAVHKYSDSAMIGTSQPLNEGVTEYFTRIAATAMGLDISSRGNYQSNYDAVSVLSGLVGEDTLASAYFDGNMDDLRTAFIDQKSEDDWDKFIEHTKKNEWADAETLATP